MIYIVGKTDSVQLICKWVSGDEMDISVWYPVLGSVQEIICLQIRHTFLIA